MKRRSSICFVLIFLFCTQFAFPQQRKSSLKEDKSEIDASQFTRNNGFLFSSSKDVKDPRDTAQIFPARGGSVDYGLALSGGGIRSALFSIGVMKALYDKGILDKVDVISSASGGGYASYWLFTQHLASGNKDRFGQTSFENDKFIKNICNLQSFAKSNVLPNKYLLKLITDHRKNGAFNAYKNALVSSFGNEILPEPTLDAFSHEMENHKVPYFIINTTVQLSDNDLNLTDFVLKERRTKKILNSVYEITPEFMGNPAIGFSDWAEYDSKEPTLSESMAISGSPKWRLESPIGNPKPEVVKGKTLRLSDGGHSENLAALALIRRGVKKVIIVDAEQDANYDFLAYKNLKKLLNQNEIGITLKVEEIDKFKFKANCFPYQTNEGKSKNVCSPPAVMVGKATRIGENPIDTDIYYIKMSQPKSIYADRFSKNKNAYIAGEDLSEERCKQRCKTDQCNDKDAVACFCTNINPDFIKKNEDLENLYTYEVRNYSDFVNYPSKNNSKFWTRAKIKFMNTVGRINPFFAYKFPHTTTADQSFYSDQLEAFTGLGYLQTIELEEK